MKITFLSLILGLSVFISPVFSQNLVDAEANRLINGSKEVRLGESSNAAEFVRLMDKSRFPVSKFPEWAKKAFEFTEGSELRKRSERTDKLGMTHTKFELYVNDIPVFGAFYTVHSKNDMVLSMNGKILTGIKATASGLTEASALQFALDHIGADSYKWELQGEEAHLKWETNNPNATYFPKGELVYINPAFDFSKKEAFSLAYKFDIYGHKPLYRAEVFVDATTGDVLFENHRIHIADVVGTAQTGYNGTQSIVADSFGGGFRLRESTRGNGVRTFDMNTGTNYGNAVDFTDGNNVWNNVNGNLDQYATDAHWGAEMTFDYYLDEHGRNSIDDNNMQINSYVHYDDGYFNAFWDGQRMTYGDGNGLPLTTLDICGHEMTHGVTEYTAGLIYQDEYGALNESFSDIFGAAVEWVTTPGSGDWLMGEDVGTLRSMSNPNAYGDPDTYEGTNWYTGTGDNGGVHTNSGVQNKWFVILTDGESGTNDLGDSYNVTGIGLTDAGAIAYRTLSVYLGPTSEYVDARFYSIQAAADLFGACSPEVIACTNAWYAVGVGDEFDATVNADFTASITSACETPLTVEFTNTSNNGGTYDWNFGDGSTSTAVNPTHTYSSYGDFTVTLYTDGGNCGTDNEIRPDYISIDQNNPCVALMPGSGVGNTQTSCIGTLYDDGGPSSNYQDDEDVSITIAPSGATSVTLNFVSFAFEESYDYLYIYDGPNTGSPLIGQYDGFNLPNGGSITSSGGSITLRQYSDIYVNEAGFELNWECTQPNSPPSPNFIGAPLVSCDGTVSFTDMSINGATSWLWDFGDGNTSTQQNPTHAYASEGTFTVTLTATNNFGNNVVSQPNYITVERPIGPVATGDHRCDPGSVNLNASGSGTFSWFAQATGGSSIGNGASFNTPSISTTTSYYVEQANPAITYNVGPANNSIGGGGNFEGDQHLIFDCLSAFTLKTVKVYASGGGNRTI
ncbi:MAG: M4 family metallopeptidase, partial [Flavobacteriales bacterium]|nr:M4 family metallopeptidase [Flavobacteriales bacterium]